LTPALSGKTSLSSALRAICRWSASTPFSTARRSVVVLKGVLADHLQIARKALDSDVFPDSAGVKPLALLA